MRLGLSAQTRPDGRPIRVRQGRQDGLSRPLRTGGKASTGVPDAPGCTTAEGGATTDGQMANGAAQASCTRTESLGRGHCCVLLVETIGDHDWELSKCSGTATSDVGRGAAVDGEPDGERRRLVLGKFG